MGSADGRRDERPPHRQCLRAFWLDATEVTNAHYGSEGAYAGPQRPRENLTWAEARDHCRKRGGRLPTEAEWEYAARGPDNLIYPWGNVMIDQFVHLDKRSSETIAVGSYPAGKSWVGALDMSGNVWEWVSSLYRPYPYDAADGREDEADTTNPRVFRGGWLSYHDRGTSAVMRFRMNPVERDWRVGFRCASDAP
jgi:iron(II)-dependent oxidoreductase